MQRVLSSNNKRAGVLRGNHPLSGPGHPHSKARAVESAKSPSPAQHSSNFALKLGSLDRLGVNHKSTARRIRKRRQIDSSASLSFHVKFKVARQIRGERQRSAIGGQNQ